MDIQKDSVRMLENLHVLCNHLQTLYLRKEEELERERQRLEREWMLLEQEKAKLRLIHAQMPTIIPEKIRLDVGGQMFSVAKSTLLREPRSLLAAIFSGKYEIERSEDGVYFIDRDGQYFHHILNYLRDPTNFELPTDPMVANEVYKEAKYYMMDGLIAKFEVDGASHTKLSDKVSPAKLQPQRSTDKLPRVDKTPTTSFEKLPAANDKLPPKQEKTMPRSSSQSNVSEKQRVFSNMLSDLQNKRADLHKELDAILEKWILKSKNVPNYLYSRTQVENKLEMRRKEVSALEKSFPDMSSKVRKLEFLEDQKLSAHLKCHENELQFQIKKSIDDDMYEENKTKFLNEYNQASALIQAYMEEILVK